MIVRKIPNVLPKFEDMLDQVINIDRLAPFGGTRNESAYCPPTKNG